MTTGLDAVGRSIVIGDETVHRDRGAMVLWAADAAPSVGDGQEPPRADGWWPPPGGVRVTLSTRAPARDTGPEATAPKAWPDINDAAGFHASDSVDVIVMISGSIWLELDDGLEVELSCGDVLIQNGTRHRWHNRSDDWPVMAAIIIGAHRR